MIWTVEITGESSAAICVLGAADVGGTTQHHHSSEDTSINDCYIKTFCIYWGIYFFLIQQVSWFLKTQETGKETTVTSV